MRVLVAIPVYNEAASVERVLKHVRRYACEILVVDDGSTDATPELLQQEKGLSLIRHSDNRGYGQSLIDAFDFAITQGFDWLVTMDCDEQHNPDRIPCFLREALKDDADIISGSRYLKPIAGNSLPPLDRR